jgi:hypothetical protein
MPPDPPHTWQTLPTSRVVEIITHGQEDIVRQLRDAGIAETEALAVIQRFSVFSVQVLRELDLLYREYEHLLTQNPNRSKEHQEWLDTKVGGMLLTIEAFIAALVAEALNKAKEDYRAELSQPREVITVPPPRPSVWEEAQENIQRLFHYPIVRWSGGLSIWFLMWLLVTQSGMWALVATGITAVMVWLLGKLGLILILIVGVVCLLMLL